MFYRYLLLIFLSVGMDAHAARKSPEMHPGERLFAKEMSREQEDLSEKQILAILDKARFQQSIVEAMSRPAESKTWKEYRPIFITEQRIANGVAFYRANEALLKRIEAEFGVPASVIVAILGVETSYGRNMGRYRVLDALVTLAFYYPPREKFFRDELKQLLKLHSKQFPYEPDQIFGSYAGAMGWGQFMPTSIAKFARDYDGDGKIDLWNSLPDICASVANYFVVHGWQKDEQVALRAETTETPREITPATLEPVYSVKQLAEWGYRTKIQQKMNAQTPATLIRLEGEEGSEVWITFQNFYAISRYNKSQLYSLAVYQLSEAIAGRIIEPLP